ncbi:MAG: nuclear transport factor 2 family protein [Burkholderiales bacterium]|nr:nuclear transport factor 2 family protein [Burkholderiales bacterium]
MSTSPIDLVRSYLTALERRDLARADAMLAPGFAMTFPGGKRFTTLEELVVWAKLRYRSARKDYERFDVVPSPDGGIVYCHGTLRGELADGTPYSGIRFIDRFTVAGGKLVDQQVWNDMAEVLGRLGTGG